MPGSPTPLDPINPPGPAAAPAGVSWHEPAVGPLTASAPLLPPASPPAVRARVRALLEVLLCSSAPTQLLIGGLLVVSGVEATTTGGSLSFPFVVAVSLADTVLLVTLMVWLTRASDDRLRDLWLGDASVLAEAWHGLVLVPVIVMLVIALMLGLRAAAPWLRTVDVNPLEAFAKGGAWEVAGLAVVVILAGGVREELQRAFVLRRFERYLGGRTVGLIVSSVAFGAGHLLQGWDAAVVTGVLGAFWARLYLQRRSSVAPIVSHAGFNAIEVLRVALGARLTG